MKLFLTATIFLLCFRSGAQQPTYFILFLKGDVMVKHPGQSLKKAKDLQPLSLNDSIFLNNEQSGVTISNISGTRNELKGKGKYKVSSIQEKEIAKGPGASSKFFSFLYEELLHPKKGFNQHSVAASWGGGSRSQEDLIKFPINGLISSADSILFTWKHKNKKMEYQFILYDDNSQEIFHCNLRDTQILMHTEPLRKAERSRYFWTVQPAGGASQSLSKYYFDLVSPEEEEKLVDAIIKEIPVTDNEILYQLEITDKLGRNGLVDKALVYFDKAFNKMKKK